ncbi:MAG: AMP-binding protein [Dehalococcoidia bacterium]
MTAATEQVHKEKGDTWPQMLKYNYEKYGDEHTAIRHKNHGIWQRYSWQDYYLNVSHLALGLTSIGFKAGDKMLIIGDNAPQWYYAELAAQANRGVAVGVYSELLPSEVKHIAENSEASFAIVQDQEQVDKLLQIKDKLPHLKKVIYWNYKGLAHYDDPILMEYGQVLQLGIEHDAEHPGLFEQNVASGKADDICAIVYTSGTTGETPKGAIHSYRTMRAGADHYLYLDPLSENDNIVPYLPPAGITEQWLSIGCHLLSASILNFAEKPETQPEDFREIGPSIVVYGARVWEAQAGRVQARIKDADVLKRLIFRLMMPIGYKTAEMSYRQRKPNPFWKALYAIANLALFRPIRDSLGLSNARICYATGAMLSPEAFRFYHALNLPLKSLYGSTEGGSLTGARNDDIRLETVGPVHRGAEVRITDEGEILYRQPGVFLGYYNDPDKTAQVLKDGWFHSGDSGFINEDGHLVFLDRMEDLVELASGDKLTPQLIESRLRFSPYIKDAWVLGGPNGAYVSAILIIDYESVGRWAGDNGVAYTTFTELSQRREIYQLIKQDIDRVNQTLPPGTKIRKYVNLHKEFDPDEAELTRDKKLRKAFIQERYRDLIKAIYSDKTEVTVEAQVRYRDGRMGTIKTTLSIQSVKGAGQ